jgi:hypothetical protein
MRQVVYLLPTQASSWTQRKRLAGFFDVGVGWIQPSLGLEAERVVKVALVMGKSPGAGVYFCL